MAGERGHQCRGGCKILRDKGLFARLATTDPQVVQNIWSVLMNRGSEFFHEELEQLGLLHDKKQQDYGTNEDPFANVRASEEFGVPAWQGCLIRMNDKVSRLKTFCKKGTLSNEGVEDSLRDLAVYSLIALVLFREGAASPASAIAPDLGVCEGFE